MPASPLHPSDLCPKGHQTELARNAPGLPMPREGALKPASGTGFASLFATSSGIHPAQIWRSAFASGARICGAVVQGIWSQGPDLWRRRVGAMRRGELRWQRHLLLASPIAGWRTIMCARLRANTSVDPTGRVDHRRPSQQPDNMERRLLPSLTDWMTAPNNA